MMSPTGTNATYDAALIAAEGVRQQAVAVATTQAQIVTAQTTFERTILAAKFVAGLDVGNEIIALQELLGVTV